MELNERAIEAAEAAIEREREQSIRRIQATMSLRGDEFCIDCGEPIGAMRRAALPSAIRCIGCQSGVERSHGVR